MPRAFVVPALLLVLGSVHVASAQSFDHTATTSTASSASGIVDACFWWLPH